MSDLNHLRYRGQTVKAKDGNEAPTITPKVTGDHMCIIGEGAIFNRDTSGTLTATQEGAAIAVLTSITAAAVVKVPLIGGKPVVFTWSGMAGSALDVLIGLYPVGGEPGHTL